MKKRNNRNNHLAARVMFSFGMAFIVFSFLFLAYSFVAFIICITIGLLLFVEGEEEYRSFVSKKKKRINHRTKAKKSSSGTLVKAGGAFCFWTFDAILKGNDHSLYGNGAKYRYRKRKKHWF